MFFAWVLTWQIWIIRVVRIATIDVMYYLTGIVILVSIVGSSPIRHLIFRLMMTKAFLHLVLLSILLSSTSLCKVTLILLFSKHQISWFKLFNISLQILMLCVLTGIVWWISLINLSFSGIASWLISTSKTSRVLEKRIGSYWAHEIIRVSIIFIALHNLTSVTKCSRVWSSHSLLTFSIEASTLSVSCTH
jgi:hypothetical protein